MVAIDFGIQNPTTFGMYGYYGPEKHYHLIDYYYHNGREEGQKTVKEYVDDLIEFINEKYNDKNFIKKILYDDKEFINELLNK